MDLTQEEYQKKRLEVISKFNKQFIDNNLMQDAQTAKIVQLLIRDANPYEIIESLITSQQELLAEFDKLVRKYGV